MSMEASSTNTLMAWVGIPLRVPFALWLYPAAPTQITSVQVQNAFLLQNFWTNSAFSFYCYVTGMNTALPLTNPPSGEVSAVDVCI